MDDNTQYIHANDSNSVQEVLFIAVFVSFLNDPVGSMVRQDTPILDIFIPLWGIKNGVPPFFGVASIQGSLPFLVFFILFPTTLSGNLNLLIIIDLFNYKGFNLLIIN